MSVQLTEWTKRERKWDGMMEGKRVLKKKRIHAIIRGTKNNKSTFSMLDQRSFFPRLSPKCKMLARSSLSAFVWRVV